MAGFAEHTECRRSKDYIFQYIIYLIKKRSLTLWNLQTLSSAKDIKSVFEFSYLHCEYLKHNLLGKLSIRILQGKPYRLIFREHRDKVTIEIIEINEHYGNK